ncbi:MAG TPA: esterase family protein, partial [Planctomycetaceae bacterium]
MPLRLLTFFALTAVTLGPTLAADDYEFGPDSQVQPGVPQGRIEQGTFESETVYPGTTRNYWVYIPQQYDGSEPACVMVFQDGEWYQDKNGQCRAPIVFDNLIVRREIPVMLVVFINPGRTPGQPMATLTEWGDRTSNRPTEYNTLDDR